MKNISFSYHYSEFMNKYLPGEKGLSANTITSYEDTFCLFLEYMRDYERISAEKLRLDDITRARIEHFLDWLETSRRCSPQTRNVRLSAIHTFVKYLQYEVPRFISEWQAILAIDHKKTKESVPKYTSVDGIKLILSRPDPYSRSGRRDLTLLSVMYDTGARVSEMCDLIPDFVRLEDPATLKIIGKGNKARIVPLADETREILKMYLQENNLQRPECGVKPLFTNARGDKFSRSGIAWILNKYIDEVRETNPGAIPDGFSCHSMRHSAAMHMLQSDVPLIYIRDILGHKSVITTEVYARVDGKKKREALEKAYSKTAPDVEAVWHKSQSARDFLRGLRR